MGKALGFGFGAEGHWNDPVVERSLGCNGKERWEVMFSPCMLQEGQFPRNDIFFSEKREAAK